MDRRNGGDPLAPPRPPKSLPRVHRPRAPEPTIMSSQPQASSNTTISTTANRSLNNVPQLSPKPRNLSNSVSSSIPPPLPPAPVAAPAPQIVPLTPLHTRSRHHPAAPHHPHLLSSNLSSSVSSSNTSSSNLVLQPASTFSRRRPPAALPSISIPNNILNPSLDPSSAAANPTTASATSPVTLAAPRPENERLTNEYVDTPFSRLSPASARQRLHQQQQHVVGSTTAPGTTAATVPPTADPHSHPQSRQLSSVSQQQPNNRLHSPSTNNSSSNSTTVSTLGKSIGSTATTTTLHSSSRNFNNNTINTRPNQLPLGGGGYHTTTPLSAGGSPTIQSATLPITKQPVSNTFSKDSSPTGGLHRGDLGGGDLHPSSGDLLNSITCPQCRKCRCEECQRPRQLPSRWLCNKQCLCSAETIIDYASCLCCVRALDYHCSRDHELERDSNAISCADDPCSCLPHKRATRWGCLAAASLVLPCLLCYWPMRGCAAICAKCYAKHSRHGCRCQSGQNGTSLAGSTGLGSDRGGLNAPASTINSSFGKGHHHHHHNHHHSSDLTPEKRLLDTSPD